MKKIAKILAIAVVAILLASCNSPVKVVEKGIKDAKAATTMEELKKVNDQVAEKMKKFDLDDEKFKNDTALQNRSLEYYFVVIQKSMELGGENIFSGNYTEEMDDVIDDTMDELEELGDELEDAMDAD